MSNSPKFFLGTDSAPHPIAAKNGSSHPQNKTSAGVFTQPYAVQYVLSAFELAIEKGIIKDEEVTEEVLVNFLGAFGREFYGVQDGSEEKIVLRRGDEKVRDVLESKSGQVKVVPFRRGNVTWSVDWKKN